MALSGLRLDNPASREFVSANLTATAALVRRTVEHLLQRAAPP